MRQDEEIRFAADSPLEGDGFEPSVPRDRDDLRATTGSESARVANGRRFRSWAFVHTLDWQRNRVLSSDDGRK